MPKFDILFILDIDDTMISSDFNAKTGRIRVYKRPYLDTFLDILTSNFNVGIWSAGNKKWVDYVTKRIIPKYAKQMLFIYSNDDCKKDRAGNDVKPLDCIWERFPAYSAANTILIDDAEAHYRYNGGHQLVIKSYDWQDPYREFDIELLKIIQIIQTILNKGKTTNSFGGEMGGMGKNKKIKFDMDLLANAYHRSFIDTKHIVRKIT